MKTLLLILFPILSYSQSFMMKMEVREHYKDFTIIYDTVKVIWAIDEQRNIGFLWDNKMLYFDKQTNNPTREQKKAIKDIRKKLNSYKDKRIADKYFKIYSLYIDHKNEPYFIVVYINNGIIIWISHINKRLPCYFFRMV